MQLTITIAFSVEDRNNKMLNKLRRLPLQQQDRHISKHTSLNRMEGHSLFEGPIFFEGNAEDSDSRRFNLGSSDGAGPSSEVHHIPVWKQPFSRNVLVDLSFAVNN